MGQEAVLVLVETPGWAWPPFCCPDRQVDTEVQDDDAEDEDHGAEVHQFGQVLAVEGLPEGRPQWLLSLEQESSHTTHLWLLLDKDLEVLIDDRNRQQNTGARSEKNIFVQNT